MKKLVIGRMIKLRWVADQKVRVPPGSVYYSVSTDGVDPYLIIGEPETSEGPEVTWLISVIPMGAPHEERGSIFSGVLWRKHWRTLEPSTPYLALFGWVKEDPPPSEVIDG